jgi:hypothetical protein
LARDAPGFEDERAPAPFNFFTMNGEHLFFPSFPAAGLQTGLKL